MGCPPRGTTRRAVLVPQAAIHGTRRHYPWSHLGTTPPCRGPTEAISVGPTVVLGPKPWSPRGPSFHTGNRACGTTVVPLLYPGVGTTRGPRTTARWGHPWSHAPGRGPARSDGAEGRGHHATLRGVADRDGGEAARRRRPAHWVLGGDRRRQRQHGSRAVLILQRYVARMALCRRCKEDVQPMKLNSHAPASGPFAWSQKVSNIVVLSDGRAFDPVITHLRTRDR